MNFLNLHKTQELKNLNIEEDICIYPTFVLKYKDLNQNEEFIFKDGKQNEYKMKRFTMLTPMYYPVLKNFININFLFIRLDELNDIFLINHEKKFFIEKNNVQRINFQILKKNENLKEIILENIIKTLIFLKKLNLNVKKEFDCLLINSKNEIYYDYLEYNQEFIENKEYSKILSEKFEINEKIIEEYFFKSFKPLFMYNNQINRSKFILNKKEETIFNLRDLKNYRKEDYFNFLEYNDFNILL
jgi:hypothetical protein